MTDVVFLTLILGLVFALGWLFMLHESVMFIEALRLRAQGQRHAQRRTTLDLCLWAGALVLGWMAIIRLGLIVFTDSYR
jgi:hypothetical protein